METKGKDTKYVKPSTKKFKPIDIVKGSGYGYYYYSLYYSLYYYSLYYYYYSLYHYH
ncbi:MAG: hypothetical protein ABII64_07830 [Elusimicrobiota bacterium]